MRKYENVKMKRQISSKNLRRKLKQNKISTVQECDATMINKEQMLVTKKIKTNSNS